MPENETAAAVLTLEKNNRPLWWNDLKNGKKPPKNSGEFIRHFRKALGLTQQQFADAIGASSYVVVANWEHNRRYPQRVFRENMKKLGMGNLLPGKTVSDKRKGT